MDPVVFFDGECGFCQRSVQWVARHDAERFKFAPLGGATFAESVPARIQAELPDSLVVRTESGAVLTRGAAFRYLLSRSRWPWRVGGYVLAAIPVAVIDLVYDAIARRRHQLAASRECPVPPPSFRRRVLP